MLKETQIEQLYNQYKQLETAISKIPYSKFLDGIDLSMEESVADKICELTEIYATIKEIKKERNKLNKKFVTFKVRS